MLLQPFHSTPLKKLLNAEDTLELLEKRGKKTSPKDKTWSPLPWDKKSHQKLPAFSCPERVDFIDDYDPKENRFVSTLLQ